MSAVLCSQFGDMPGFRRPSLSNSSTLHLSLSGDENLLAGDWRDPGFREVNWAVFRIAGERPLPGSSSSRVRAVRTRAGGRRGLTGLRGGFASLGKQKFKVQDSLGRALLRSRKARGAQAST